MLLTQLQQKENFSNAENVLASYILGNPDTALRLTLQKLADAAFVSKPTVIRLYRKLGFKNYSDFRLKFYSELASQQKYLDDIDPNLPFGRYDSCRSVARRISELMIQTITNCYGLILTNRPSSRLQPASPRQTVSLFLPSATALYGPAAFRTS